MQKIEAVKDLFAPSKTALWAVEPSNAAAMKLLEFWHEIDDASGDVKRRFDTARGDTRFLGDLYQNLSEDIREKYALLQTPDFIEEFISDRTLEPAIAEFGFENVPLIDPTCGSGRFLLGAFTRLFRRWERKWQETGNLKDTNRIDLTQRALNQAHGVDLNPYAVTICRFRLIIAALHACETHNLEQAHGWKLNVSVGDSLYHGYGFDKEGHCRPRQWGCTFPCAWRAIREGLYRSFGHPQRSGWASRTRPTKASLAGNRDPKHTEQHGSKKRRGIRNAGRQEKNQEGEGKGPEPVSLSPSLLCPVPAFLHS